MLFQANFPQRPLIRRLLVFMVFILIGGDKRHRSMGNKIFLTMKITTILLFVVCLSASAGGSAQSVTLSMKNAKLERVFKEIKKQTGYVFFYDALVLKNSKTVNINLHDKSVVETLNQVLANQPFDYSIERKTITIVRKAGFPDFGKQIVNQNEKDTFVIKGTITNVDDNTPLDGVSVINLTSGTGTQTNKEGRFSIQVVLGDRLAISYIGFSDVNYEVKNNDDVFVKMAPKDITDLSEVVVVGYGTQKKTSLVSSISTVNGEDLQFGGRNLSTNLQGQVAGVISFQRSGEPGYDNATFWIRGISTYNGAQNPLILVDGIPRSFNDIDPNEIATFSVLKDAAATAVYGAEGANGVILVTTKRGRIQKTEITYRGEYSSLTPLRMPEFMGSAEFLSTYNEALSNEGKAPIFDQTLIDRYKSGLDNDLYPDEDWLNILLRKHTYNTNHNLTFRGGSSKARFFVAGSFYNESGLFKNNALEQYSSNIGLKRYNLRSNIDLDVTPTTLLRVDMSGQYLETNYPGVSTTDIFNLATTAPPYLYPAVYSDGTVADHPRHSYNRSNPYNLLNNSGYTNEFRTNIQTRIGLEQKLDYFLKGLSARAIASYDYFGTYVVSHGKSINSFYAAGRDLNNKIIYTQIQSGTDQITDGSTSQSGNKNIYLEAALNYANNFDNKHDVTGMLLAYQKESQVSSDPLPFRKLGYVSRVTYAYDRRYSVEFNMGITGSEAFAKGHRFGVFPAVGLAWIASNEKFYPESLKDIVSNLKVRASYGLTGNDYYGSQRFLYRGGFTGAAGASLGYNSGTALNSYSGYTEDRFSAPTLSWETEKKKNFGVDLGLFGNKLNIIFDYFNNFRYDILVQRRTVSGAAGFNQPPFQNFGKVTNKGYETSVSYHLRTGENSSFSARGNFTYARNKIVEMDEVAPLYPWMASTGNRLNMNNVFVADRLFTEDDFNVTTNPDGSKSYTLNGKIANQNYFGSVMPGDIKYKDLNGDGVINQFDQTKYDGNPTTPEITYGFGVSYNYKGISLSMFFTGIANTSTVLGGSNSQGFFPFTYGVDESSVRTMVRDRWTEANPSQDVLFPRIRTGSYPNNMAASTWWMRDAGFLRLKNAELGYDIPKKTLDRLKLNNVRVYVQGYNLLTWDKIKYWDPEQGNLNAGVTYPQSRTFTFGLQATF